MLICRIREGYCWTTQDCVYFKRRYIRGVQQLYCSVCNSKSFVFSPELKVGASRFFCSVKMFEKFTKSARLVNYFVKWFHKNLVLSVIGELQLFSFGI